MELLNAQQREYTAQEFKKILLKNAQIDLKEFNDCTFIKCAFAETAFQDCSFHNCIFKSCDLSLVRLKGSAFTNTRFEDSQVIGVNWTETSWATSKAVFKPVDFFGCVINYSTFMGLNLKKIAISKCTARDVSFEEANLTQANCRHTDFMNSRFMRSNLTEADFTGAKNYSIAPSLNTLKKTKFSLPEAMSLLYNLDIHLTDYESEEK